MGACKRRVTRGTAISSVNRTSVSSPLLSHSGESSESGNDSIQRSWDRISETIEGKLETIDRYDYMPLTNYRILQMENASLKGGIAQLEAAAGE